MFAFEFQYKVYFARADQGWLKDSLVDKWVVAVKMVERETHYHY